jgi:hypothetical protein
MVRARVAFLLLLVVGGFVCASVWDRCDEAADDCRQLCHAGCLDGCATAPVPGSLTATSAAAIARVDAQAAAGLPIARPSRPEFQPPRC